MLGRTTKAYVSIVEAGKLLTDGTVISIDPSIGSNSSMPGFAVYQNSQLIESGIFSIPIHHSIPQRLQELTRCLRNLYSHYPADCLVYEEIPPQRYGGGGNAGAHSSLIKSVGAILSVAGPTSYVGLHPFSWKKLVRPTYRKGDEEDAIEIGYIAIEESRRLQEASKSPRQRRKKSSEEEVRTRT